MLTLKDKWKSCECIFIVLFVYALYEEGDLS